MSFELPTPVDAEIPPGAIRYGLLTKKHPEYREDFWRRARAFYRGGEALLGNQAVMEDVFPRQIGENDYVYDARKRLASYVNHTGAIVNHLLGLLFSDPARVQSKPEMDDFYTDFLNDVSPPDGEEIPINKLVSDVVLDAVQCQKGYALVELPQQVPVTTLAQQEELGLLDAWAVKVSPESVFNWEVDKNGEFKWALICFSSCARETVFDSRSMVTETYWMYDRQGWKQWVVQYREGDPPREEAIMELTAEGEHTFGRVPLIKLCLPDGLWILSKLESLAREYFNKRNALSWAEYKALLPVLYEFLDPGPYPNVPGPGGDEGRATNQKRSPAHVQERTAAKGQGDRAEWIGPPHAPFETVLKSCDSVRDEMHRVVHQMALSADNKNATLRRAAESKEKDSEALKVVLQAYGELLRRWVRDLLRVVESGRGDTERQWIVSGLSRFDVSAVDQTVEEETVLDTVELPSPTFKAERKKQLARKVLGDSVPEEVLETIDQEIEQHYSFEGELAQADQINLQKAEDEGDMEVEDFDVDDQPQPSRGRRTLISTFKGEGR